MEKVKIAVIGAGLRGHHSYAVAAKTLFGSSVEFVAVVEPNSFRKQDFANKFGVPKEHCYNDWDEFFAQPKMADAVIIATNDDKHLEPTKLAMEKGYHILLEKPMSNRLEDIVILGELVKKYPDLKVMVCHVLRYTNFFNGIKQVLDSGRLGKVLQIQHNENIEHLHFSHSFCRGNWRNSDETSPIILAKSCHDMDILLYLLGDKVKYNRISAFGDLVHFTEKNYDDDTMAERCVDCPQKHTCLYSAINFYALGKAGGWTKMVIDKENPTYDEVVEALKTSPYGKCVYKTDNNVCDSSTYMFEYDDGTLATFNLSAFTNEQSRSLKIMCEKGEIRAKGDIQVLYFQGNKEVIQVADSIGGHEGGDTGIMKDFICALTGQGGEMRTSALKSVESHIAAFAAEQARITGTVVDVKKFWEDKIESMKKEGKLPL